MALIDLLDDYTWSVTTSVISFTADGVKIVPCRHRFVTLKSFDGATVKFTALDQTVFVLWSKEINSAIECEDNTWRIYVPSDAMKTKGQAGILYEWSPYK